MSDSLMFHAGNRRLQDQFDSRRIADRLEEKLTRTAFTESVAGVISPDGVVHLPKVFRYVVAVAPMSTMWALDLDPDNE